MLLEKIKITIDNSSDIITFEVPKTDSVFGSWERYITVDGNRIFHTGNVCSTCSVFFDRLAELNQDSYAKINTLKKNVVNTLNEGIQTLDQSIIDSLKLIMPNGEYDVLLSKIIPKLVHPGKPGDYFIEERAQLLGPYFKSYGGDSFPQTEYYRTRSSTLPMYGDTEPSTGFFEFLIPLFTSHDLNQERVNYYKEQFVNGTMPTAISLSILDTFTPHHLDEDQSIHQHMCLMHYLIDGHHKAYAAAMANKPLTIISFLAVDQGLSDDYEVGQCIKFLKGP